MAIYKPMREASEETDLAVTLILDFQPLELLVNNKNNKEQGAEKRACAARYRYAVLWTYACSWKAFLNLQKNGHMQIGGLQHGQEVADTMTLPLDPQEVAQEMCKAVPFIQVLSQPGCMAMRVRNHLCFGYCSSFFIPGVDPASLVLCNSCVPTRRHWVPVFLWCRVGSPVSRRRVRTSTVLVERCQCSPKA
ncbi:DAN domain family member 5 isoform 1-T1 [Molossus nigricans]